MTSADDSQAERQLPGKDEEAAPLASPSELENAMNRTFRYIVRRGLFAVLIVHPFYLAFQKLYRAEAGEAVPVKIPFFLLARIVEFKFWISFLPKLILLKAQLEIENDKLIIALDYRLWLTKVTTRALPKSSRTSNSSILRERDRTKITVTSPNDAPPQFLLFLRPIFTLPAILFYLPWYGAWTLIRSLSTTIWVALRLVPALLAILVVVFITGDAWKMFGLETNWRFFALIMLIAVLTTVATLVALKGPEGDWQTSTGYSIGGAKLLSSWASRTPANPLLTKNVNPFFPIRPTKDSHDQDLYVKMHEDNISILYAFTIVSNVIGVAFWIALTFIVVGVIAVNESLTRELSGTSGIIIMRFNVVGESFILTRQLILVSVILGGVAALTFTSGTLQDTDKRRIFTDSALTDLERTLGALAYYYGNVTELLLRLRDTGALAKLGQTNSEQLSKVLDKIINSPYFDRGSVPKGCSPDP